MKRSLSIFSFGIMLSLALAACAPGAPATEEAAAPQPPEELATATLPPPTATMDTGYEMYAVWSGTWTGSWTNTTFGSTGTIDADVAFDPDGTATFAFDAGGLIFGAFDPPQVLLDASFDGSGVTINLPANEIFGDVLVTINPDGTFEMVGDLIPASGIARVEATGAFNENSIEGIYMVFFDGSGFAEGKFEMSKSS